MESTHGNGQCLLNVHADLRATWPSAGTNYDQRTSTIKKNCIF